MPRILVADDNSNIQKMVALALKESGIDVVAVANGEAAVRKLPEAAPDLVLADIFMPVRSGYEVCEFIKKDTRYSHIPVVLLVGAFDPLDEREAQRVGADGILKKPFVPPDPLINMVKELLAKAAGERLVAVAVPVAASSAEASPSYTSRPEPRPEVRHETKHVAELPSIPEYEDILPEELAPAASVVDFSNHEKPMAFSSLLEAPAVDDPDLVITASRDPSLGEPAFWSHTPTEETSKEEAVQDHTWGTHAQPLPLDIQGEPLPSVEQEGEQPNEPEPLLELAPMAEIEFPLHEHAEEVPSELDLSFPKVDAGPEPDAASGVAASHEVDIDHGASAVSEEPPAPAEAAHHAPEIAESDDQPWDLEPIPAEDAAPKEPVLSVEKPVAKLAEVTPISLAIEHLEASARESLSEMHAIAPSAPDSSDESAQVAEEAVSNEEPEPASFEAAMESHVASLAGAEPVPAAHSTPPAPEMIEAIVMRIVERMQPKVFDVVTREILRPLVEALVRREIEKH